MKTMTIEIKGHKYTIWYETDEELAERTKLLEACSETEEVENAPDDNQ